MPCIKASEYTTGTINGTFNSLEECQQECSGCYYTWNAGTVNPGTGELEPGEWTGGGGCPPSCPCGGPPSSDGSADGEVVGFDCECVPCANDFECGGDEKCCPNESGSNICKPAVDGWVSLGYGSAQECYDNFPDNAAPCDAPSCPTT